MDIPSRSESKNSYPKISENLFDAMGWLCYSSISDAGWSSSVARRAHNPKVIGSNPVPATKFESCLDSEFLLAIMRTSSLLGR